MTVARGTGTVAARLVGGPMAKQSGEVVAPPPTELAFGANGGFVYTLDTQHSQRTPSGKPVATYRYDRAKTRAKLQLLGVPLQLVSTAVSDDEYARVLAAESSVLDRPELGGFELPVRIELHADEWRAYVADQLEDTKPREEIVDGDVDALSAWAEELGRSVADRIRTEREAASS